MKPFDGRPYVFISYSHADADEVIPVVAYMARLGYRVWHDEDLPYVNDYNEIIANAIKHCHMFLVFFSCNSVKSEYVRNELYYALDKGKQVCVAMLEECSIPDGVWLRINHINHNRRWEHASNDEFIESICKVSCDCMGNTTSKPQSLKTAGTDIALAALGAHTANTCSLSSPTSDISIYPDMRHKSEESKEQYNPGRIRTQLRITTVLEVTVSLCLFVLLYITYILQHITYILQLLIGDGKATV